MNTHGNRAFPANDGGAAFPYETEVPDHGYSREMEAKNWRRVAVPGMTLRDYFAARAVAGLMSGRTVYDCPVLAAIAYRMADAMISARERTAVENLGG